jgi:hypothetical protein
MSRQFSPRPLPPIGNLVRRDCEVDSDHGEQAWIDANASRVREALNSPEAQAALYRLLGGEPDPEREQEALAREVAKLRLKWRPGS